METKTEEKTSTQRYYHPSTAVLPPIHGRYYRTCAIPKPDRLQVRARAVLPPRDRAVLPPVRERYYRPSGTTASQQRYYQPYGMGFSLSCLLLYPLAPTTINRSPFPTF